MKRLLLIFSLCLATSLYSQAEVVFLYDEAGNQIYRGTEEFLPDKKTTSKEENSQDTSIFTENTKKISKEELAFWQGVRMAPVPVREVLTIDVTQEIQANLESISVYSMLGGVMYLKKNTNSASLRSEINMSSYIEGVYVVKFHLRDGKIYSQNILKH